jgi:hydroxymethylbilane synthase
VRGFLPAPAQGALAVQARKDDEATCQVLGVLDDAISRFATEAEREFLRASGAGCHTPAAAYATAQATGEWTLLGQVFSDDGSRVANGEVTGTDATNMGKELATRLRREIN